MGICHGRSVRTVTIGAADVITPVLAAAKIIVTFLARMTRQTGFRYHFRILSFERNDLGRISSVFEVSLAGAVTGFASLGLSFPARQLGQLGVLGLVKFLELVLVTSLAGFASDVIVRRTRRRSRHIGGHVARIFF